MRNLLLLLAKNNPFLTWLLLAIVSIALLCSHNAYQRSVWLCSANSISGAMYQALASVTDYFSLASVNEELSGSNSLLWEENQALKQELQVLKDQAISQPFGGLHSKQYLYSVAHVVNNSITQSHNYITIDRGSSRGVDAGLGVVGQHGVVGIVDKTSANYALVVSLLNPKIRLSAKLKNSEFIGSVVWKDCDSRHVLFSDLPINVTYNVGDTVVTTGYSASFPAGIPVGKVVDEYVHNDNNLVTLRLQLFTDFGRLSNVFVIANKDREELSALQATVK